MATRRSQITDFYERGLISSDSIEATLRVVGVTPNANDWRAFINYFLLIAGALAIAIAVLFFVAYNWDDIGRFAKFAMVQGGLVLAIAAYWKFGEDRVAGKAALLVATILLGVLLALYGQTYQTGVDPWQLFFYWALLMLPWAVVGRSAAIWVIWVALLNLAIGLYYEAVGSISWLPLPPRTALGWLLFGFNAAVLATWEGLAGRFVWLNQRAAIRLVAIAGGIAITALAIDAIVRGENMMALVLWALWLVAIYLVYRRRVPDLFMLAGGSLSAIVVAVAVVIEFMDDWKASNFLVLAILVIGMGSGAAFWLKRVQREWGS